MITIPIDIYGRKAQTRDFVIEYSNGDTWQFRGYVQSLDLNAPSFSEITSLDVEHLVNIGHGEIQLSIILTGDVTQDSSNTVQDSCKPGTCRYCGRDRLDFTSEYESLDPLRCPFCHGPTSKFRELVSSHAKRLFGVDI